MKELQDFQVKVEIPVAWGEMDAMGHVNNINYFRYFETARIRYFELTGVLESMKETGIGPILAEATCRFRKPLLYPDTVTVGVRVNSVGKSSFVMEYMVVSASLGIAATGIGVIVMYDYRSGSKTGVPALIRKAIEDVEKKKMEVK